MTKQEFIDALRHKMAGLPKDDIEDRVAFYTEMIDDRVEDGLSEEQAVAEIGSVDDIVAKQIEDTPITKIVREKVKPKRKLKTREIILIIASSPLWLILLIALGGVIFAGIVTFFSVVIAAWAGEISLIIGSISSLVVTAGNASLGQVGHAIAYFGITLIYIGLAMFLFIGAVRLTQFMYGLGRKVGLKIKTKMVSRGGTV